MIGVSLKSSMPLDITQDVNKNITMANVRSADDCEKTVGLVSVLESNYLCVLELHACTCITLLQDLSIHILLT